MSQEIIMPDLGTDTDEALLINWTKDVGDSVKQGDVIAEVETDKTTVEVESPVGGTILQFSFEPGDNLTVGQVIGFVGEAGEEAPSGNGSAAAPPAEAPEAPAQPTEAPAPVASSNGMAETTDTGRVKISPVARKIAEERGLDISQIPGSGPGGRIVKSDVEGFEPSEAPAAPRPAAAPAARAAAPAPATGQTTYGKLPEGPDVEIEEMSRLRTRIAERMIMAKQLVPHFYVTAEMDVDPMLALRKELNSTIEDKAARISVNDMIVKALALTARQFPQLNAHYYGDKYVFNQRVNVGIAVALDGGGLINVVAKDADKTAIGTMAVQNRAMIGRARDGKLKPDDMSGSTITISNLGMYDVDSFVAIINPPEAAILAVGSAKKVPIVKENGQLGAGTRLKATLSVDHRVGNGAEAGEFMAFFKGLIENPMRLLM